jgi:hypothetical protein
MLSGCEGFMIGVHAGTAVGVGVIRHEYHETFPYVLLTIMVPHVQLPWWIDHSVPLASMVPVRLV